MNKPKDPAKPRRSPVQARSRATVEAILEAAACILRERGWEALTTNAVAERAGVNIGSLYQYFPNKQAITAELQRRHAEKVREAMAQAVDAVHEAEEDPEAAVLGMVKAAIALHRSDGQLQAAVLEEIPKALRWSPDDAGMIESKALELLGPFMQGVPRPDLAAAVFAHALKNTVHGMAEDDPRLLEDPDLPRELARMLCALLRRQAPGQ